MSNPESYYKFQPITKSVITGGLLADRCTKNLNNLFLKIDNQRMADIFTEEHKIWFAEPEFAGKYLDTAARLFQTTLNPDILVRAKKIADSMIENQREDGYLGTYFKGLEFENFSVWNQSYVTMGLISYYEVTGDERAMNACVKCMDYIATNYLKAGGPDILKSLNMGISNSCIILSAAKLYGITKKPLYLEFCDYIISRWESCNLAMVSNPVMFQLGCMKAAEMIICYRGLLELGRVTGREGYAESAAKYWNQITNFQIGVTGNGSLYEYWAHAYAPQLETSIDLKPNENCVAVCYMKMCADLYAYYGDTKYLDAFEKALYNHVLGSQAIDGTDFSYYQGTIGRKIQKTKETYYKCCRYRGMNILSHLPEYVAWGAAEGVVLGLYISAKVQCAFDGVAVSIEQTTDYPRAGAVGVTVKPAEKKRFALKLRVPVWCTGMAVKVNGKAVDAAPEGGYVSVEREWSPAGDTVELMLDMPVKLIEGLIEDEAHVACQAGPILLAIDTRYGTPVRGTRLVSGEAQQLVRKPDGKDYAPILKFEAKGEINGAPAVVTLVDYASAGSIDNEHDRFQVWLPAIK